MATWTRIAGAARSMTAVQALTEAAPVSATDGVSLDSLESIVAVVYAPTTQTFDGTGTLLAYTWSGTEWARASRADLDMSYAAGLAIAFLPALEVQSSRDQFMWVPSGVGVSGAGGNMTTKYLCTMHSMQAGTAIPA